ncbi:RidA family protein [Nonomuraea sp. 3N208]|uniref:RidA family protein n=1 Tax=Nonomuraea sp. 3N208 TaxID=3457421 RepID=UPI003FCC65ED
MSTITHVNPPALHNTPFFSQGTVTEPGRTLYVGGQNGTDSTGAITGGLAEQSAQAMRNVIAVLNESGVGQQQVAKLNIYLSADGDLNAAFAASAQVWGQHPTAITVVRVAGLARPEALVEIDAIAVLPTY